ncbi:MAG: Thiol-disulfide oxidoreductase ResA [Fimbriimonadaceae bacterium]|nr:Thiol-disulfide oxidoreductase ResA [Fimbriimonadaceae bacterium]
MKIMIKSAAIGVLALAIAAGATAQTLKVGDPAPDIKVAKWAKGKPVKGFERGQVYVVEFWATWCGPCKQSIPHLTEVAKKFKGKANVTGVSIWETEPGSTDTAYVKKVEDFVKEMGSQMDYNVAIDGVDAHMANTWMKAAGENGIPSAFIVDQNGKIAWIGHPMSGLDDVLAKVVDKKWDIAAEAEKMNKAKADEGALEEAMQKVMALAEAGNHKEAVTELDAIIAKHPTMEAQFGGLKFNLMMEAEDAGAYDYAKKLAAGPLKGNGMMLNNLAWMIVDPEAKWKTRNVDVALEIAKQSVEAQKEKDPYSLDTLAYAYFLKNDLDKAISWQEKAVKALSANVPEATQKEIKDRLEMFKKKKGGN